MKSSRHTLQKETSRKRLSYLDCLVRGYDGGVPIDFGRRLRNSTISSKFYFNLMGMRACLTLALVFSMPDFGVSQWTTVNLHPPGVLDSVVYSVDGTHQAGYVFTSSAQFACVWQGTALSAINFNPFGSSSGLIHCMRDGKQAGALDNHATLWMGAPNAYVSLRPAGSFQSMARAIDGNYQAGNTAFSSGIWRASLWQGSAQSWINLHPANENIISSWVFGARNGQQVGYVRFQPMNDRAVIWTGSASSWVDIHPSGAGKSYALDTHNNLQVGYAIFNNVDQAGYWRGTRNSWVSLHPANYSSSTATAVHDYWVVGHAFNALHHAFLWNTGANNTRQNLHNALPSGYNASQAHTVWSDGRRLIIGGAARNSMSGHWEAIIWIRNLSLPGDANGDGCVNDIDLLRVLFAFGQSGGAEDLDGNGMVGDGDLLLVLFNFGSGC